MCMRLSLLWMAKQTFGPHRGVFNGPRNSWSVKLNTIFITIAQMIVVFAPSALVE